MYSFIKVLIYTNKSGRLRELKNKGEVQLGNPKSGRSGLREIFIKKFKSKFQQGFTKVVETWAGRLRGWSWGELWLYYTAFSVSLTLKSVTQSARSNCRINFGTVCSSFFALRMATCSPYQRFRSISTLWVWYSVRFCVLQHPGLALGMFYIIPLLEPR